MTTIGRTVRWLGLGLLALLLALASACRNAPGEAPAIEVAFIDGHDLARAREEATGLGLTRRDARGRVVAGLAQSWRVSNDGSFVIFRLRPALSAGGRSIEAADVARALQAALRAPGHAGVRDLFGGGIDVRAPLPEVIEIRLPTPQPELPALLALPETAIRQTGSGRRRTPRLPGPLMEAEPAASRGSSRPPLGTLLVPDPGFALAEANPTPSGARLRRLDPEEAIRLFLDERLDLVVGGLLRGTDEAARIPTRQGLVMLPARAVARLAVNQSVGPLHDRRVRQALAMAIDRETLARSFGADGAPPLEGLMPPSLSGVPAAEGPAWAQPPLAERRAGAQRLLAEAGFGPEGTRLKLRLAAGRSPEETRLIEALANDWAELGIDLVAERRSPEGLLKSIAAGEVELALELVESPVDAPTLFLSTLPCGRNRLGICLPEADLRWRESWRAPTLAARMAAIEAAHQLWLEEAVLIPLFQPVRWWLVSRRVAGWAPGVDSPHALEHIRRNPR